EGRQIRGSQALHLRGSGRFLQLSPCHPPRRGRLRPPHQRDRTGGVRPSRKLLPPPLAGEGGGGVCRTISSMCPLPTASGSTSPAGGGGSLEAAARAPAPPGPRRNLPLPNR